MTVHVSATLKFAAVMIMLISCCSISYADTANVNDTRFVARIAVVDMHAILEHSLAIQSIKKSVDSISHKIQQDLLRKDVELKKINDLLMGKQATVTESTFQQEVHDFNKKVNIAQKEIQDQKVRLEQAHAEGIGKVQDTITKIINNLAKKYNLDLVIPISSTQVIFAKDSLNITQEVIMDLNNRLKHVIIKY